MKTTKFTLSFAVIALSLAIAVVSCKKKDTTNDTDSAAAEDQALADRTASDVVNIGSQSSETKGSLSDYRYGDENSLAVCAAVNWDSLNRKITVTFNGGVCMDGKTRSGILVYDFSGSPAGAYHFRNFGFTFTVTSSNYVVNGMAVTINKTVTNTTQASGFNPATKNLTWTMTGSITINTGVGTITHNETKNMTLLNTSDTVNVYHGQSIPISWKYARIGLTGSVNGTTAKGETYTANVITQLVRDFTCAPNTSYSGHHPFINGTLDFTPGSKATRHIDFGYPSGGACDDLALVTIGSYTKVITLK